MPHYRVRYTGMGGFCLPVPELGVSVGRVEPVEVEMDEAEATALASAYRDLAIERVPDAPEHDELSGRKGKG